MHWEEKGAFTGESSRRLCSKACGIGWALVEALRANWQFGGETVNPDGRQIQARAASNGLNVMYCIGETLAQREAGKMRETLDAPARAVSRRSCGAARHARCDWPDRQMLCLAYEPVWAIGTGKTATNEEAEEAHRFIRQTIWDKLGMAVAQKMPILYGGSVTPENVSGLMSLLNLDGPL